MLDFSSIAGAIQSSVSSGFDGLYWGFLISTVLFGVTLAQGWIYFNNNQDGWGLRLLVATLIALDSVATGLDAQFIRYYLGSTITELYQTITKPFLAEIMVAILIIFLVNLFFASRVYLLHDKLKPNSMSRWLLPGIIIVLSCGLIVITSIMVYWLSVHDSVIDLGTRELKIFKTLELSIESLVDAIVTVTLSWTFAKPTMSRRTSSVLQRLLVFTVGRGLLVTSVQLAGLVWFLMQPTSTSWLPFQLSTSKIYVITMVTMLNMRPSLREDLNSSQIDISICQVGPNIPEVTHLATRKPLVFQVRSSLMATDHTVLNSVSSSQSSENEHSQETE